ncbi:Spy/CpxP family protein refolding chaperone [Fundidesulfovibrio soli]|uniref:Spy/CpxP family protein refolding chaperone n=1 Tax=Fundidesulfovibrio soli TaxID=2922716 RepID=UPI001FAF7532|nr:Spy/CpxP family protein refolding chaperone [Fundidesulfovibrio soli]
MKHFAAALAVVAALAVSAYAAQDAPQMPPHPGGGFMHDGGRGIIKMSEELGLSAEQKRSVAQILKESREQGKALRESMRKAMDGMHAVMDSAPGDETAVRKAAQVVSKAGEELAVHAGKVKARIDGVLTQEQKVKLAQLKQERKDKFKDSFQDKGRKLDEWIDQTLKS